jgi:hypothetical protein
MFTIEWQISMDLFVLRREERIQILEASEASLSTEKVEFHSELLLKLSKQIKLEFWAKNIT